MAAFKLPDELDFLRANRLPQKTSTSDIAGKVCVLTGATSGIGYHTALRLAKANVKLVLVVRNQEKAEALCAEIRSLTQEVPLYFLADLAQLSQVRVAAEGILQACPRIDLLINNAGIHMTTRQCTVDGFETAYAVNHLASFLLTSLLLKRMVESAPSRILQVNSEGHRFNGLRLDDLNWEKRRYNGYLGYGASKTAQLLTVWDFDERLQGKGVTINAMHPGAVQSNIGSNNGFWYNWFNKHVIQPGLKSPILSAEALHYLASAPELEQISGRFFNLTNEEIPAPHARNRALGAVIFQKSIESTNLPNDLLYEV